MIYLLGLISGFVNGIFASGAGQILIFVLIFLLKKDSHMSRATSIICISCATFISLAGYLRFVEIDFLKAVCIVLCGVLFGFIGAFLMKKTNSKWLNLISGVLVFLLAIFNLVKR